MHTDMRFLVDELGNRILQFRTGVTERVGNPKHDRYCDGAKYAKYVDKVKWGKWKTVRFEDVNNKKVEDI